MKKRNLFQAISMALALIFNIGVAVAANKTEGVTYVPYSPPTIEYDDESDYGLDYGDDGYYSPVGEEPEWPVWEEEQPSSPPATSDNFIWKGHNPADEGWRAEEGDLDQATLIHWSNNGLTPLYSGGHIFEISPEDSEMVVVAKDFTGNAGDWLVIDWAVEFNDYPPYMDVVFGYMEGEDGVTTTLFSAIVTDGSSEWFKQSWIFLEKTQDFTIYLGAMNALDESYEPKLLIGGINVLTFTDEKGIATELSAAPVPVPGAVWLLGSALFPLIRRRKTA